MNAQPSTAATLDRMLALSGVAAIAVLLAGIFAAPTPPQPGDPIEAIRAYYVDHSAGVRWYVFASALSAALLVVFVSALASAMRRVPSAGDTTPTAVLGAGVLALAATLAGIASFGVLASGTVATAGPDVVRAVFDLGNMSYNVGDFMLASLVAFPAVLSLRADFLPRWLGWSGVTIAVAWAVASVSILVLDGPFAGPNGAYGLTVTIGFSLWIAASSVALFRLRPDQRQS